MLFLYNSYGTSEFSDCGNLVRGRLHGKPDVGQYGTAHALRKTNKDPSVHSRKPNMDPSVHFRKANMEFFAHSFTPNFQFHF